MSYRFNKMFYYKSEWQKVSTQMRAQFFKTNNIAVKKILHLTYSCLEQAHFQFKRCHFYFYLKNPIFKANSIDPDLTDTLLASEKGQHFLPMPYMWVSR